jgi:hypothetical protein
LTSALGEGEWLALRPGSFTPDKEPPVPIGGPHSRSGQCEVEENHLPLPGIELRPSSS